MICGQWVCKYFFVYNLKWKFRLSKKFVLGLPSKARAQSVYNVEPKNHISILLRLGSFCSWMMCGQLNVNTCLCTVWKEKYRYPYSLFNGYLQRQNAICVQCGTKNWYIYIIEFWVFVTELFVGSGYVITYCVQCGRKNIDTPKSWFMVFLQRRGLNLCTMWNQKCIYLYYWVLRLLCCIICGQWVC